MRAFTPVFDFVIFLGRSLLLPWDVRRTLPRISEQIFYTGAGAIPIVILAGVFVGLTTVVQTSYQLLGIVPRYFIGMGVGRMLLIELGPVFTAFIFASRSASAIAAELGAMRNSDQIDALLVMGIDPYRFLCLPRIVGAGFSLPILVVIMEFFAALAAVVAAGIIGVAPETLVYGLTHFVQPRDFIGGLIKAIVFGVFIGTSGCYFGFNGEGGARGVGKTTTRAVVVAGVLILFFDFIVAVLMFSR
ncbi:MAG: MlaE family ABC transporter permease [bacterium]